MAWQLIFYEESRPSGILHLQFLKCHREMHTNYLLTADRRTATDAGSLQDEGGSWSGRGLTIEDDTLLCALFNVLPVLPLTCCGS